VGGALAGTVVATLTLAGAVELRWAPSAQGAAVCAGLVIPLYLAAFMEEIAMRGYLLRNLQQSWGLPIAIGLSSTVFATMHLANPNPTPLGLLNIALFGVWFAATVIVTGRLWFAIGAHVMWNWLIGPVLSFPVSGMKLHGLFATELHGPDWLTGGLFGVEGSVVCTAVCVVALVVTFTLAARRVRYAEPPDDEAARPLATVEVSASQPSTPGQ